MSKTDNFKGRGDHDNSGKVGGAAKPLPPRQDQPKDADNNGVPDLNKPDYEEGVIPANYAEGVHRNVTQDAPESWGDKQAREARENEKALGEGKLVYEKEPEATSPSDRVPAEEVPVDDPEDAENRDPRTARDPNRPAR